MVNLHYSIEKLLKFLLLLQISLVTWLASGTRIEFLLPMFFVSCLLFIFTIWQKNNICSDSYLYNSLIFAFPVFAVICTIAYFNPFAFFINSERFSFLKYVDYIKWLPTSVRASFISGNPFFSLCILTTSFFTVIAAINLFSNRKFAILSLFWFVLNVWAMGMFAVYQKCMNYDAMYGVLYAHTSFYGTFFLENAGGTFLVMGGAAAAALGYYFALNHGLFSKIMSLVFFFLTISIFAAAAFSGSVAVILLSLMLVIVFSIAILFRLCVRVFSAKTAIVFSVGIFCVCVFASAFAVIKTYKGLDSYGKSDVSSSVAYRLDLYKNILNSDNDMLLYGWGGECSRYMLYSKLPLHKNPSKTLMAPDRPHSDILEYFLDYGILGLTIFFVCGVSWLADLCKNWRSFSLGNFFLFMGVLACLLHSAVDMELHIPSTMLAFGLLCALSIVPIVPQKGLK